MFGKRQIEETTMADSAVDATVNQDDIFGPFLALLILTMLVWFYMYSKRIPFLVGYIEKHKGEGLTMEDMADPKSRHYFPKIVAPTSVVNPSDNLKNLFEVPVAFYAMVGYLFVTNSVDTIYVRAAWAFVALRYVHSANHCTINHVSARFYTYVVSTMALWFMLVRASIMFAQQKGVISS